MQLWVKKTPFRLFCVRRGTVSFALRSMHIVCPLIQTDSALRNANVWLSTCTDIVRLRSLYSSNIKKLLRDQILYVN